MPKDMLAICCALENSSRCEQGHYDSRHIGPWSQWQGHLNAELMVVGQDWGDTNCFIKNQGLEAQRNPTNNMLRELLGSIGIDVGSPHDCRRRVTGTRSLQRIRRLFKPPGRLAVGRDVPASIAGVFDTSAKEPTATLLRSETAIQEQM